MPDKQLEVAEGGIWSLDRKGTALADRSRCKTSNISRVREGAQISSSTGKHTRGDSAMNMFVQLTQRFNAQTNANEAD